MIIWTNVLTWIGGLVFNYGVGFAAIVWGIKKLRE